MPHFLSLYALCPLCSQVLTLAVVCTCAAVAHGLVTLYEPDRMALMDVYIYMNGASWTTRTNWKRGDPCDPDYPWFGVTCVWDPLYKRPRIQQARRVVR